MTNTKKSTLAKQVTFENYFLSRYGVNLDTSKREVVIKDPTREDKKPSISIDFQKQLYNDFANGVGGSIIDWLMNKEGATFSEACDVLLNGSFSFCRPTSSLSLEPTEPPQVITAIVPIWSYALKNYLEQERCIPKEVYSKYLKEIRYTRNGKSYFALGFKTLSGWEIKNAKIKSAIPCKDISFIKNKSHRLIMFEGMMDFLSYTAMYDVLADDSDYVILNSLSLKNRALPLLKDYESVECYYDNDQKGHDASIEALEVWESLGKARSEFGLHAPFIKGKDLNEQWVKECQRRKKQYNDMKTNLIAQSKCYKYALRSCTNCKSFNECLNVDIQWDMRFKWLDCAKCGCVKYRIDDPAIMAEKPLKTYCK